MVKLLISTRNDHKTKEIQAMLGAGFQCYTLKSYPDAPEVIEDAGTFAGNAAKKATELAAWLGRGLPLESEGVPDFVLADDSGLEVDALGGAPGVHSARFAAMDSGAKGNSNDADNNAKLLRLLKDVPSAKRTARFRCVIALVQMPGLGGQANLPVQMFDGACEGRIDFAPRGQGGFGYDPLFVPSGFELSFAELGETAKNQISHRAKALEKLRIAHAAT
jgi:XTP/dITP diphosphohydrolase